MRTFLAITLPTEVQDALSNLQQTLAESRAKVKWVAPENLHVTLKFLGSMTEERRQAMAAMLRQVARDDEPFPLGVDGGVGAFPSMTSPRVIWVGLSTGKDVVTRLAAAIEREGEALALFAKAERPFAAHVTLGRVRSPKHRHALVRALQECAWKAPAPWRVTSLTLYQSVLGSEGPTYSVLFDAPLRASASG